MRRIPGAALRGGVADPPRLRGDWPVSFPDVWPSDVLLSDGPELVLVMAVWQ